MLGRLNANSTRQIHRARAVQRGDSARHDLDRGTTGATGPSHGSQRGVISVRDFRRRKTITLFTGQPYLAKSTTRARAGPVTPG